jgi:hypothetical protein
MPIGLYGNPLSLQELSCCAGDIAARERIKNEIIFSSEELYKKFCYTEVHSRWVWLAPFLTTILLILVF